MTCWLTGSRARCQCGPGGPRPEAGFTLIEVLVSFAVAALVMGVLYRVYSSGLQASLVGQRYSDAVLLAQSALDEATAPPLPAGDTVGIYHRSWMVQSRTDLLPAGTQLQATPYDVSVTVSWDEGTHRREVSLSALRLAAAPAAGQ
jgi:general secretion pathway protein I